MQKNAQKMFQANIRGNFKNWYNIKLILVILLLWPIEGYGDKFTSNNNNNNNNNNSRSNSSNTITLKLNNINNLLMTPKLNDDLNSPITNNGSKTILHEVHDGSYSMKKDRPDNLPVKSIKKKPYSLLDKLIATNNYEKPKSLKRLESINPMVFDFNLGDLEDLTAEYIKKEPALNITLNTNNNNNNTKLSNNLKLYKAAIHNEDVVVEDEDDIVNENEQEENVMSTEHPSIISTSSSVSYSFASSVVTISPHIFKVTKNKSLKKGRELLKHNDLAKTLNNNHNSILHYFNENNEYNNIDNDNENANKILINTYNLTHLTLNQLRRVNVFHILVNLYDHFYWQSSEIRTQVSTGCGLEMQAYLTGLHGNYYWAQKAYDASGHYRGQLLFGNDKWLGQKPFCYELNRQTSTDLRKHFAFEFYVALINLNLRLPEKLVINLQLGECLPKSCSAQDVQHILNIDPHVLMLKALGTSNATMNSTTFKILRVRNVPGIFTYWREIKFQLFASFIVTIIALVLAATWYQSKLNDRLLYMAPSISIISQKIDTSLTQHISREPQYNTGRKVASFELYQMTNLNEYNNNVCNNNNNNNNNNNSNNNATNLTGLNGNDNVINETINKHLYGNGNNNSNNNSNNNDHNNRSRNNNHHQSRQILTNSDNSIINEIEYKIESSGHHSLSQDTYNIKQELGLHEQLLLCFAFQTNACNILNIDSNKEMQTSCVHGLRVISVLWTIMVHTYLQMFSIGENRFRRIIVERSPFYQIVGNATFSVDTFFFISGFLVTLIFLKLEKKYPEDTKQFIKKGVYDTLVMFIYRYIRLTPAYLFVILFNDLALRQTFDSSIFQPTVPTNTCYQFWWRNILYINNFYPLSEICMIWSWYMANEMQFYIMATILLILSMKYFKLTALTIVTILLSSWGVAGMMSLRYHYTHKVSNPFESFDFLYDKPWQRVGTYLMGMFTGYIIQKTKKPPTLSNRCNNLLWLSSIGLMALIIFGVWRGQLDEITTSFYVSIGHTAFSFGLVWIVLSCCWGLAPTINRILSYRCLWPLSRLTYCAYLIHPVIMLITAFRMDGTVHLNSVLITIIFMGNAVLSFIAAFFISVLMEAPVIRLLKIIFHK